MLLKLLNLNCKSIFFTISSNIFFFSNPKYKNRTRLLVNQIIKYILNKKLNIIQNLIFDLILSILALLNLFLILSICSLILFLYV